jgi:hypothetical protein
MFFDHEVMKKDFGEGFWKTSEERKKREKERKKRKKQDLYLGEEYY